MALSRKRFYHIGALGNGTFHRRFYDTVSTGNFTDFLISTYLECGKFVIFPDNAAYHKPRRPKVFLKAMNGEIKVHCFPAYAPEPNPVKAEWKSFRKATGNRLCESVEEMQKSIRTMLGEEIPAVKTFDYLTR